MSKTILNLLMASLLLIFVVGCGGGGGDSVSSDSTNQNLVPTDPNTDPTDQIPPVAIAIFGQTVKVGDVATLDGSGSYDQNGENDSLTYDWKITSTPSGSAAVSPVDSPGETFSFTVDVSGEYTIQLVVTDSWGMVSEPCEVVVSTDNSAPVANAILLDSPVQVLDTATLDGSGSSDPDGDVPLTFKWEIISTPAGSAAVSPPSDYSDPFFSFTVDVSGEYTIQLVVTDSWGMASEPYEVVVSTINSKPVADAGPDQELSKKGDTIQLDGSGSSDPDGDPITYTWTIIEQPPKSSAVLSDDQAVKPTFVADSLGTYVIELLVTDGQGLDSFAIDEVVVSSGNVPPVADAGVNQIVPVGETVLLDGSGSYDANRDPLTYSWNITSEPTKDSQTELIGSDSVYPNFTPLVEGIYTISLVVTDDSGLSDTSTVTIYAIDAENIDGFITALINTVIAFNELDDSDFNNANNRNALTSKIIVIVENYLKNGPSDSNKLTSDIASHMDGCALGGEPDANDWIMNCPAQEKVYPLIMLAIDILETM